MEAPFFLSTNIEPFYATHERNNNSIICYMLLDGNVLFGMQHVAYQYDM